MTYKCKVSIHFNAYITYIHLPTPALKPIKDRFARQAELRITNSKKGTVKVDVGYFSEEDMKNTLNWKEKLGITT